MCGIAGILSFSNFKSEEYSEIALMTEKVRKRGPDDEGIWTDNKRCILGFRRLAILDLSPAGHQPMVTRDGRYAIVFNGEVYNFREIRSELEGKGVRFRSSGDTEVVLQALVHWGKEALDKFNGMFALALYDSFEKRILLARDHAGIKPLYYLMSDEGVLFASQYDQIMAHPWSKRKKISQEALGLYLRFAYIPPPYAVLENTYLLAPGSWVEIDTHKNIQKGKHFEFPKYQEPCLFGEEAYEAVDAAVSNAVRRQLVSDVPVGAFLSGGIDSPLVVAKMKACGIEDLKTFTIGTNDSMDESQDASIYANQLGVEQILHRFTPGQALLMLEDVIDSCGEPFADYSIFPTMLVSRLARENGFKVMLSGDGGDELFWGYPKRFGSVIEKAAEFRRSYGMRVARWAINKVTHAVTDYPSPRYHTVGEWYRSKHTRISNLIKIFPEMRYWPAHFDGYDFNGTSSDEAAQWTRSNEFNYHLGMVLLKVDRASMYHSVEVRVPLLDKEVIQTACRVDWKSCLDLKTRIGKQPLRYSLRKHVPYQTESKKGFSVPMQDWLQKDLKPLMEELVLDRDEICGAVICKSALRQVYKELPQQSNHAWWLWSLLSLALWERKHYLNRCV